MLIEDGKRHGVLQVALVEAGIHHDHQIERGYDEQTLSAKALRGHPPDLAPVDVRAAKPKEVAVAVKAPAPVRDFELLCRRHVYPGRRHDLLAVPGTMLKHQLTDFGE